MFQFPSFPAHSYVFTVRYLILHQVCSHIRKSPDRGLFTAPRGLSQLVTSFIGSWCQGIHLTLFFAWTSQRISRFSLLGSRSLELLEFRKQISFRISLRIEKASFFITLNLSPFGEIVAANYLCCVTHFFGKTYLISFFKLRIKSVLIICSFYSSIYFIRFSMNTGGLYPLPILGSHFALSLT